MAKKPKQAWYWNEFHLVKNGDGSCAYKCHHCTNTLSGVGSTRLGDHLFRMPLMHEVLQHQ